MVGRTPEYLGKKIEAYDVKMAMLYVLIFPLMILVLAAASALSASRFGDAQQHRAARTYRKFSMHLLPARATTARRSPVLAANRWYNLTMGFTMLVGPLFDDRSHAGGSRQPGRKKMRSAIARHVPGNHTAVHCACW